jgi:hypothetical protein
MLALFDQRGNTMHKFAAFTRTAYAAGCFGLWLSGVAHLLDWPVANASMLLVGLAFCALALISTFAIGAATLLQTIGQD